MPKERRRRDKKRKKQDRGFVFDKYEMYQRAVQEPEADVEFIEEIFEEWFGRTPLTLREDFCGASYMAYEWVASEPSREAWGIDLDDEPLEWGRRNNGARLDPGQADRLTLVQGDVLTAKHAAVDVVVAFNFSFYTFKTRDELLEYFRVAHANLGTTGMFVLDIYGGPEAQELVEETTEYKKFSYIWDQDEFDPIQSRMKCYIHFEAPNGERIERAFSYDWRLWTIVELREILADAGFAATEVYWEGVEEETGEGDGEFERTESAENTESWIAYVVGVKD